MGNKSGGEYEGSSRSRTFVNSMPTWKKAWSDQSPNQSRTQRLNKAGDVAARDASPFSGGFIVKTT
jgi:hypothetical protein